MAFLIVCTFVVGALYGLFVLVDWVLGNPDRDFERPWRPGDSPKPWWK